MNDDYTDIAKAIIDRVRLLTLPPGMLAASQEFEPTLRRLARYFNEDPDSYKLNSPASWLAIVMFGEDRDKVIQLIEKGKKENNPQLAAIEKEITVLHTLSNDELDEIIAMGENI